MMIFSQAINLRRVPLFWAKVGKYTTTTEKRHTGKETSKNKHKPTIPTITMKQYTEITLENIGALKSMINGVKREANEKKDYIEKSVILV